MTFLSAVSESSRVPQLLVRPLLRLVHIQRSVVMLCWVRGLRFARTNDLSQATHLIFDVSVTVLIAQFAFAPSSLRRARIYEDSGLRFKASFNKYFKRMLQEPLRDYTIGRVEVIFDRYGYPDTMRSFERYMKDNAPTLFVQYEATHAAAREEPVLQLADLLAGTVRRYFAGQNSEDIDRQIIDLVHKKAASFTSWPPAPIDVIVSVSTADRELEEFLLDKALKVFERLSKSEMETDRAAARILDQLIFLRTMELPGRQSIHADELMEMVAGMGISTNPRHVQGLVGRLRDEGILIAGSSSGRWLALEYADISEYLNHSSSIIKPMIRRMGRAQQSVKMVTDGEVDILSQSLFLARTVDLLRECDIFDGLVGD